MIYFNFSDLSYHCYVLKDLSPNVAEFVLMLYISSADIFC